MKLLISGATRTVARYLECGVLVTPWSGNRVEEISKSGRLWAADNSAYSAWDKERFWKMLARINHADRSRLLWVACPDVVSDAQATINRWLEWFPQFDYLGLPAAFVGQDGLENIRDQIPWNEMRAFFIGGSTEWKLSEAAMLLGKEAKARGKLLHVGRVNSEKRIRHMLEMNADTIDGRSFSAWPDKKIPKGLKWIKRQAQYQSLF